MIEAATHAEKYARRGKTSRRSAPTRERDCKADRDESQIRNGILRLSDQTIELCPIVDRRVKRLRRGELGAVIRLNLRLWRLKPQKSPAGFTTAMKQRAARNGRRTTRDLARAVFIFA